MDLATTCNFPQCTEQELIPATCLHCHKKFCSAHTSSVAHRCSAVVSFEAHTCPDCGSVITYDRDEEHMNAELALALHLSSGCNKGGSASRLEPCHYPGCANLELVAIHCSGCGHSFCTQHRILEQHRCPAWLADIANRRAETERRLSDSKRKAALEALAKKGCENTVETAHGIRSGATRSEDDVILKIHFAANLIAGSRRVLKPAYFHFLPSTSVGRVLDAVCRHFDIPNNNNNERDPDRQLWLHSVAEGIPMIPASDISSHVASHLPETVVMARGRANPIRCAEQPTVVTTPLRSGGADSTTERSPTVFIEALTCGA